MAFMDRGRHVYEGPKIRSTDSTGPKDVYSHLAGSYYWTPLELLPRFLM